MCACAPLPKTHVSAVAHTLTKPKQWVVCLCYRYADLVQNREKDYKFSFEKMISPTGNTAIYLLNAYARLQQVNAQPLVQALDAAYLAKARKEMEVCNHHRPCVVHCGIRRLCAWDRAPLRWDGVAVIKFTKSREARKYRHLFFVFDILSY